MPRPGDADACLVLPNHARSTGVELWKEIFIDSAATAFFISGLHWALRFRDVSKGFIPTVRPDAFPSGVVLTLFFPNWADGLGGRHATRSDWKAHLQTLVALSLVWGAVWGSFTLLVLLLLCVLPVEGKETSDFCLSPWTYILVRAAWTDVEVVLVGTGSFVLWLSRASPSSQPPPMSLQPLSAAPSHTLQDPQHADAQEKSSKV